MNALTITTLFLTVALQLCNSNGTQRVQRVRIRSSAVGGTAATNSSDSGNNGGATESRNDCQKLLVDIPLAPPRTDCSPGVMKAVPICSGTCKSYATYQRTFPYKVTRCTCCGAATYRHSKRTVSFQCGKTNETVSYNIAAVIECGCTACS